MELNDYNAVLQQLASTPGLQERLQKQFALSAGQRVANFFQKDDPIPSVLGFGAASSRAAQIQALPYQVGSGPDQAWPGDPNYKGLEPHDPEMDAAIARYLKSLIAPSFQLPSAPSFQ